MSCFALSKMPAGLCRLAIRRVLCERFVFGPPVADSIGGHKFWMYVLISLNPAQAHEHPLIAPGQRGFDLPQPLNFSDLFAHFTHRFPSLSALCAYPHCVANASAIPGYVRLRSLPLLGPGGILCILASRPSTTFVGINNGRFFSQRHVFFVSPCPNCHG